MADLTNKLDTYNNGLLKLKTMYKHTKLGIRKYALFVAFYNKTDNYNYTGPFANIDIHKINENPSEINNKYKAGLWSEYGYMKDESKLTRTAIITYTVGKNIGKKNETSALQQAVNEALSKYDKKIQEGLVINLPNTTETANAINVDITTNADTSKSYYLMAAHDYKKVKKDILKFPCIAQRKLDGLRAGTKYNEKTGIVMYSRARKEFTIKENIAKELAIIFKKYPNWFLDGEFYVHGVSLQAINSLVKNPDKGENLEYHIFDCFYDFNRPLMLRVAEDLESLKELAYKNNFKYVKIIDSFTMKNIEDVDLLYQKVLKDNYEGLMLKNLDGVYEASLKREIRSYNILKYKPFYDSEFKIVGVKDGKGKESGAILFILETDKGKQFSARPRDIDTETRKLLYSQAQKYPKLFIGKKATIMYDSLSDAGVPQRLRFKDIRDVSWDYFLNYKG